MRGFVVGDRILQSTDSHANWMAAHAAVGDWRLTGASAVGQKHIADGKPRDDAFAARACGVWLAVAVSDGVGSRPLSRYGSTFAVEALCEQLIRCVSEDGWENPKSTASESAAAPLAPRYAGEQPAVANGAERMPMHAEDETNGVERARQFAPPATLYDPRGRMVGTSDGSASAGDLRTQPESREPGKWNVKPRAALAAAPVAATKAGVSIALTEAGVSAVSSSGSSSEVAPLSSGRTASPVVSAPEVVVVPAREASRNGPQSQAAFVNDVDSLTALFARPESFEETLALTETGSESTVAMQGTMTWTAVPSGGAAGRHEDMRETSSASVSEDDIRQAFAKTREGLEQFAQSRGVETKAYACTLLGLLVNTRTGRMAMGHIGDGLIAGYGTDVGAQALVNAPTPGGIGEIFSFTKQDWHQYLAVRVLEPRESAAFETLYLMTDGVAEGCIHPPPDDILLCWTRDVDKEMRREETPAQSAHRLMTWLATYKQRGNRDDRTLALVLRPRVQTTTGSKENSNV